MTRHKWTTKEQEKWLEERKPAFLVAKQSKTLSKEFFPVVTREFRERWPELPPTQAEIDSAGSLQLAERDKRDKYDKRTCSWYHNNTRNLTNGVATQGTLKLIASQPPRRIQAWQAYSELTYHSRWKADVDTLWNTYKETWKAENGDTKPAKTRFQIMNEFIKQKYEQETDEMKQRCEELRDRKEVPDKTEVETEGPDNISEQRKRENALKLLPRTLVTVGDSLLAQTGWYATILTGGPAPGNPGTIMTYITHVGKTPDGKNFEAFLGKDFENILMPFERFLYAAFTNTDSKNPTLNRSNHPTSGSSKEENRHGVDENIEDGGNKDCNDSDREDSIEESDTDTPPATTNVPAKSDYEKRKEKNIAELKQILAKLNSEEASKMLGQTVDSKMQENTPEVAVEGQPEQEEDEHTSTNDNNNNNTALTDTTAVLNCNLDTVLDHNSEDSNDDGIPSLPANADTTTAVNDNTAANSADRNGNINCDNMDTTPLAEAGIPTGLHIIPAVDENSKDNLEDSNTNINTDVINTMPEIDISCLPSWLVPIVQYLKGISSHPEWLTLVQRFTEFESRSPPPGTFPTQHRPKEVATWIKNRKKMEIRITNTEQYGGRFREWWASLQPNWRKDVDNSSATKNPPDDERWGMLRKGGASGMCTVMMGLSWWVAAEKDSVTLSDRVLHIITDMSWVLRQLVPVTTSLKRVREDDESVHVRKSARLSK